MGFTHLPGVLSSQEPTTAMFSCIVLQPAASRILDLFRALPPKSFCGCQGGLTPDHYCVSSTGCRFDSRSCKLAVLTFKICCTATPAYLSRLITAGVCGRTLPRPPVSGAVTLRSSTDPLMSVPTDLSGRAFCCSAPTC